jgi:hypothetical protein
VRLEKIDGYAPAAILDDYFARSQVRYRATVAIPGEERDQHESYGDPLGRDRLGVFPRRLGAYRESEHRWCGDE